MGVVFIPRIQNLKFNLGDILDESEFSSKSGTPSPMVSRVTMLTGAQTRSASDLLRDYRETSVASSRGSSDITEPDNDNTGVIPSPSSVSLVKTGSLSSLGTRYVEIIHMMIVINRPELSEPQILIHHGAGCGRYWHH